MPHTIHRIYIYSSHLGECGKVTSLEDVCIYSGIGVRAGGIPRVAPSTIPLPPPTISAPSTGLRLPARASSPFVKATGESIATPT